MHRLLNNWTQLIERDTSIEAYADILVRK